MKLFLPVEPPCREESRSEMRNGTHTEAIHFLIYVLLRKLPTLILLVTVDLKDLKKFLVLLERVFHNL